MTWVALALVFACLAFVVFRARAWRTVLSDAHLAEITGQLGGLRDRAARDAGAQEGPLPHAVTTQGLVVCLSTEAEASSHHLSISYRGRRLPVAAGTRLIGLLLWSLHVDPAIATTWANRDMSVHHAAFSLDVAQQSAWRSAPRVLDVPNNAAARQEIDAVTAIVRARWAGRFESELPL